jgi:hypothetical protein
MIVFFLPFSADARGLDREVAPPKYASRVWDGGSSRHARGMPSHQSGKLATIHLQTMEGSCSDSWMNMLRVV